MIDYQFFIDKINAVPLIKGRRIVAIAGGPASGKSTFSAHLQDEIPRSCVIPMDGFHRDNEDLKLHGLFSRKGAHETFDVKEFSKLVRSLRSIDTVPFPTFDRAHDCVVPNGGTVEATDQTVLVEGNYLLLNVAPWRTLADFWDFSIALNVPIDTLRDRLVARWLHHGLDLDSAKERAEHNDLPNARFTAQNALPADLVIKVS